MAEGRFVLYSLGYSGKAWRTGLSPSSPAWTAPPPFAREVFLLKIVTCRRMPRVIASLVNASACLRSLLMRIQGAAVAELLCLEYPSADRIGRDLSASAQV